jgi:hypothetical protein
VLPTVSRDANSSRVSIFDLGTIVRIWSRSVIVACSTLLRSKNKGASVGGLFHCSQKIVPVQPQARSRLCWGMGEGGDRACRASELWRANAMFVDTLRPPCSGCGRPLVLIRIEPEKPGCDLRTYYCAFCQSR